MVLYYPQIQKELKKKEKQVFLQVERRQIKAIKKIRGKES
jgi:hypothetical protein